MSEELALENLEHVETSVPHAVFSHANSAPRGKFRSLTLINWNGFFARTFDLDELVTTLSGGNGAGNPPLWQALLPP